MFNCTTMNRIDGEHTYTLDLNVDKLGRVYIPINAARDAQLRDKNGIVFISNFNWCNAISLNGYYHHGYDKKISTKSGEGFHVSVKKYFGNTNKVRAVVDPNNSTIFIVS